MVAAPDKFRGTARAPEIAAAVGRAARACGWSCDEIPVADGGEGLLDVFGGPNRTSRVTGPLGRPVDAAWRLADGLAVIEMATASGLDLAGGAAANDPLAATTRGTGELVLAAIESGARRVVVGAGGSATTDGGLGAVEVIGSPSRLAGVDLVVACDVEIPFADAATRFAAQKGASPAQVVLLRGRLERLAQVYEEQYGVAVGDCPGSGAAGGLAGGLAVLGARLVPGFDLVVDHLGLDERVAGAALVVTGEGLLDEQSFAGKAVGGMAELAHDAGIPVLVVAGQALPEGLAAAAGAGVTVVDLSARFGSTAALADPAGRVAEVVEAHLRASAVPGTGGGAPVA